MFSLLIVHRKFINKSNKTHSIHMEPVQVIITHRYSIYSDCNVFYKRVPVFQSNTGYFYLLLFFWLFFCLLRIFSMSNHPLYTASSN